MVLDFVATSFSPWDLKWSFYFCSLRKLRDLYLSEGLSIACWTAKCFFSISNTGVAVKNLIPWYLNMHFHYPSFDRFLPFYNSDFIYIIYIHIYIYKFIYALSDSRRACLQPFKVKVQFRTHPSKIPRRCDFTPNTQEIDEEKDIFYKLNSSIHFWE